MISQLGLRLSERRLENRYHFIVFFTKIVYFSFFIFLSRIALNEWMQEIMRKFVLLPRDFRLIMSNFFSDPNDNQQELSAKHEIFELLSAQSFHVTIN
jgi:hypothetical protein